MSKGIIRMQEFKGEQWMLAEDVREELNRISKSLDLNRYTDRQIVIAIFRMEIAKFLKVMQAIAKRIEATNERGIKLAQDLKMDDFNEFLGDK